jgi:hypothetical protein
MKKFATTSIFSLISLLVLTSSGVTPSFASVSNYSASDFSQFCSQNTATCSKNEQPGENSASVSCPEGKVIDKVYVHAGDAQTVYELPDAGFDVVFSNNNNTATVTRTTHPHALSWIAVTCTTGTTPSVTVTTTPSVTVTPTVTTTPTITIVPTTTPTVTPTPTSACPVSAPDPIQFEAKIKNATTLGRITIPAIFATYKWFEGPVGTWTLKIDVDPIGGENHRDWRTNYPNVWPFLKPVALPQTITEAACPTTTVTPTNAPGIGGPGDGLSDGRSDGKSSTPAVLGTAALNDPYKGVLGTNTMAGTGSFEQNLMNIVGILGMLLVATGFKSYKRELSK